MQVSLSDLRPVRLIAFWLGGVLASAALPAGAAQSVSLAWNPSTSGDIAGYNIYYGVAYRVYTNVVTFGNVTNATVSGLLDGTTYYFAAKARNASGVESDYSNEASYAVPAAATNSGLAVISSGSPAVPVSGMPGSKNPVATSTNPASTTLPAGATQRVTLAWNPSTSSDIAGYNLYYGVASHVYTNVLSFGNVAKATISGLRDGTTYYFAAKARNASGAESDFSNEASYAVPTPAAVLGSAVRSKSSFTFNVNGVSGNTYVVQASTNMVNWVSLKTNIAPFTFVDSQANQFKQRFYRSVFVQQ